MNARTTASLRIIGGRWRRRRLEFLDLPEIRPTPNRVRETLFNWLAPRIEGTVCLDLFAGSGALGFEAVSRGAASALLVENNRQICAQLETEAARFATDADTDVHTYTINVRADDAHAFVRRADTAFDIVFLDPPFGAGLAQTTLAALAENRRALAPAALVYVEWEAGIELIPPDGLELLHKKQASEVQYALLERR